MNILFFIAGANRCGPTNVAYNIIKYVKENSSNIKIHLLTIWEGQNPDKYFIQKYTDQYYNLNGVGSDIFRRVNEYVNLNKIDIIHSHGLIADVYSGMAKNTSNTYRLSTLHCNLNEVYHSTYRWYKYWPYLLIHKAMLKRLDKVVGVSENALSSINNLRISPVCIYNGTESTCVISSPLQKPVVLLYIGVLNEIKNIYFLIDQMKQFSKDNNLIELHIYGKGELEEKLKAHANGVDNILFKGFVENPSDHYSRNSILVSSSLSEGLPMAVIEALGAGLPALLSNIKSHKEIKSAMDKGVELFEFDHTSFNDALNCILKDMGGIDSRENILDKFNQSFSYKCMGEKYLDIYNSVSTY
ncbi:glycosyltransferase family 4 protein [Vibrio splendidus]